MGLERFISYWGIGSASPAINRGLQFVTKETGWKGFVDTYIVPQRKLGISRFLLYMPFGQEEKLRTQVVNGKPFDTRLRFDQYQQAVKAGLTYITTGFADAIRPLVDDGCQVIAYTGTLGGAPELERRKWDRKQFLDDCLAPFKAANCDLAFDSACLSVGDYVTSLARDIRLSTAAKVYCESMPLVGAESWAYGDVISVEEQYQVALLSTNRDILVNPKSISGELIRMFTTANSAINSQWWDATAKKMDWAGWYRAKVPAAVKDSEKHTVCLHVRSFIDQGGKLEELVA